MFNLSKNERRIQDQDIMLCDVSEKSFDRRILLHH